MNDRTLARPNNSARLIAGRYFIEETIGRGGAAEVYRVLDTTTQRRLALKQLLIQEKGEEQRSVESFEFEFYSLTELRHPRVVEVYDFGIADRGPYYTMELLDGGDLRELLPMPWQKACALLYDVCSVLSLLHSRGLIHRDLTPRNIRCTDDSHAKLIDFGTMIPAGHVKRIIGTPAFTAPEVLAMQSLDARADLYSLGVTLYFTLTGTVPYPARNFSDLRTFWYRKPRPPSHIEASIPKELDKLVMSLIDLNPMARPVSAAEVIERISAIASLPVDEHLLVPQAYLLKPVLIGREDQLLKVRKKISATLCGSGAVIVVESTSSGGKSRFLDACVLEGKLAGAAIVRADADDAQAGDWGVISALTIQLMDSSPEIAIQAAAPFLDVLCHVFPYLKKRFRQSTYSSVTRSTERGDRTFINSQPSNLLNLQPSVVKNGHDNDQVVAPIARFSQIRGIFDDPQHLRSSVHNALCNWLLQVSERIPLIIAVDDVHRIDEPSAAFLAIFANQLSDKKAAILVTAETDGSTSLALNLLKAAGSTLGLQNLSLEDTQKLLTSVFGEIPQVSLLADRLYRISEGNPGTVMQIAQHMVDEGVIRYRAGSWTLPHHIDIHNIPSNLTDALKVKMYKLSAEALMLAQSFAISPESRFTFDECLLLIGSKFRARLAHVVSELQSSGILSTDGYNFGLNQSIWVSVLKEGIDEHSKKEINLRLAQVFLEKGGQACRVAKHLFEAEEVDRGLDTLLSDLQDNKPKIEKNARVYSEYVMSLPEDWMDIYRNALEICRRLGRPRRQSYLIQITMIRIGARSGIGNLTDISQVFEQLSHDCGLDIYWNLDDTIDAKKRIARALELAQQRYDSISEQERVLPPVQAISEMASTISNVISIAAISFDNDILYTIPSLEPLALISPALSIVERSVSCIREVNSGRLERSAQGFREVLQRVARRDRAGLDDTTHKSINLGHRLGLGLLETSLGINSSLHWADEIEEHPLYHANAWRIRLIYHLRQGNIQKAEECKRKMEMLQIRNNPSRFFEGMHQYAELTTYTIADDLIGVKRIIKGLDRMAARFASWVPILHFANGEYQRIRGDYKTALIEHEKALSLLRPGHHLAWLYVVGAIIRTLFELDRIDESCRFGERHLALAEDVDLGNEACFIRLPLALVQASLGEFQKAIRNCQHSIDKYERLDSTGINPGLAYETRAHVAILMKDEENFNLYAKKCAEQYTVGNYPTLIAKYEKLMKKADVFNVANSLEGRVQDKVRTMLSTKLDGVQDRETRLRCALELLVEQSNSSGGYLYTMQDSRLIMDARCGNSPPPRNLDSIAWEYIQAETGDSKDTTVTLTDLAMPIQKRFCIPSYENVEYQLLMLNHDNKDSFVVTGLVVLYIEPGSNFSLPGETIVALSKYLYDIGDVQTMPMRV